MSRTDRDGLQPRSWGHDSYPGSKRDRQEVERRVRRASRWQLRELALGGPEREYYMLNLKHPRIYISVR